MNLLRYTHLPFHSTKHRYRKYSVAFYFVTLSYLKLRSWGQWDLNLLENVEMDILW